MELSSEHVRVLKFYQSMARFLHAQVGETWERDASGQSPSQFQLHIQYNYKTETEGPAV